MSEDHKNIIDILDDSELYFESTYVDDFEFNIILNIKKNANHQLMSQIVWANTHIYSYKDRIEYLISKSQIILRIKKLTGFSLKNMTLGVIPIYIDSMCLQFHK